MVGICGAIHLGGRGGIPIDACSVLAFFEATEAGGLVLLVLLATMSATSRWPLKTAPLLKRTSLLTWRCS